MTSNSQTRADRPRAIDAVTEAGTAAWNRVSWMLFTGPAVSVATWGWWGLILVLSGATSFGSGGSSSWDVPGDTGDLSGLTGAATSWLPYLAAPAVCVGLVLMLAWLYVCCRFRFVAIDGVMSGEPRIRDAWRRSSAVGLQYFFFELLVLLACLIIALPVILSWLPLVASAWSDEGPGAAAIAFPIVTTLVVLIPLAIAKALLDWFVYDIALPFAWLTENDFWAGLRRSFRVLGANLGAVLLFLLARMLVAIVGGVVFAIVACLTCVLWIWPALAAIGLLVVSIPFPPLLIVTLPLAIALFFVVAWMIATAGAPILVFYRAWSIAFVGRLEPDVPRFDESARKPSPPAPPAPPPAGPVDSPPGPGESAGGSGWGDSPGDRPPADGGGQGESPPDGHEDGGGRPL